jgi:hypothetical protein
MCEFLRRDGAVVLTGGDGNEDQVIVEGVVTAFTPRGNSHCVCGAALRPWSWRCVAADSVEIGCGRCHRVHGIIGIGVRVHR